MSKKKKLEKWTKCEHNSQASVDEEARVMSELNRGNFYFTLSENWAINKREVVAEGSRASALLIWWQWLTVMRVRLRWEWSDCGPNVQICTVTLVERQYLVHREINYVKFLRPWENNPVATGPRKRGILEEWVMTELRRRNGRAKGHWPAPGLAAKDSGQQAVSSGPRECAALCNSSWE